MKKLDNIQNQYVDLLCRALQLFYKNDATVLFNKPQTTLKKESAGNGKIVNERAMVGCVYRYMWCLMQQQVFEIPEFDIDVEYDRMIKDGSEYYEKEISYECERTNCIRRSNCIKVIVDEIQRRRNSGNSEGECGTAADIIRVAVRPDIIVHNRNKSGIANNGLVVEFKKVYRVRRVAAIKFDLAKLCYFTCQDKCTKFNYKVGVLAILHPKHAEVWVVYNKKVLSGYNVNSEGCETVSVKEFGLIP